MDNKFGANVFNYRQNFYHYGTRNGIWALECQKGHRIPVSKVQFKVLIKRELIHQCSTGWVLMKYAVNGKFNLLRVS